MRLISLVLCLLALASPGRAATIDDLTTAAYRDDGRTVMSLLLGGVDPNGRDAKGRSPLEVALKEESGKALEVLLGYPALDVNAANAAGETPLMLAALKARLDWAKMLVQRGAQINRDGWTPLHYACSGLDRGVAAWLIGQGAQINARSPNGSTPLMMAARYGPYDLAEELLKLGADLQLRNELGLTAVDFAAAGGREKLQKTLAQKLEKASR
jgi:ankyrin repeat protein